MSATNVPISDAFRAAAIAEQAQVEQRLEQVLELQRQAEGDVAAYRIAAADHRARLTHLAELTGQTPVVRAIATPDPLKGAALRRQLTRYAEDGEWLHYSDWLKRMTDAGELVAGADPGASMLTALNRHPLVEREPRRSGRYRLVATRLDEHRRKLASVKAAEQTAGTIVASDERKLLERVVGEAAGAVPLIGSALPTRYELGVVGALSPAGPVVAGDVLLEPVERVTTRVEDPTHPRAEVVGYRRHLTDPAGLPADES